MANLTAQKRRRLILETAADLAEKYGYQSLTDKQIAAVMGGSHGAIYRYFPTMAALKDSLILYALAHNRQAVVAQAVANNHPLVVGLPAEAKRGFISRFLLKLGMRNTADNQAK